MTLLIAMEQQMENNTEKYMETGLCRAFFGTAHCCHLGLVPTR